MPRATERGHIYFIGAAELDAMKVGFAVDPMQRLSTLQTGNPHRLHMATVVPVERAAEATFHQIMRPHRLHGEWYPADSLLATLEGKLIEEWGDRVQENNDGSHAAWIRDGDEWTNPLGIYLTAVDMRALLAREIEAYFAMTDDDWDGDPPAPITNHWLAKPQRRIRRLRPGYV